MIEFIIGFFGFFLLLLMLLFEYPMIFLGILLVISSPIVVPFIFLAIVVVFKWAFKKIRKLIGNVIKLIRWILF